MAITSVVFGLSPRVGKRLSQTVLLAAMTFGSSAQAGLRAPYDSLCDFMQMEPPSFDALRGDPQQPSYFEKPIPRNLILVSLCQGGSVDKDWNANWVKYAQETGLSIVDVGDVRALQDTNDDERDYFAVVQSLLGKGDCSTAEKMVRWHYLSSRGGAAVSSRMSAPQSQSSSITFQSLFDERGLVVLASDQILSTRPRLSGVTVSDSLVLCSAGHPIVTNLRSLLVGNIRALQAHAPLAGASYLAGSVALTRALSGAFVLLPRTITQVLPENAVADE